MLNETWQDNHRIWLDPVAIVAQESKCSSLSMDDRMLLLLIHCRISIHTHFSANLISTAYVMHMDKWNSTNNHMPTMTNGTWDRAVMLLKSVDIAVVAADNDDDEKEEREEEEKHTDEDDNSNVD
jgi:hypothetical protein